jgi:sugar fermentation stimulation protein A
MRRYQRFLSDHKLADGRIVTAHCANPGSMLGLTDAGTETWLAPNSDPRRKLRYSWEMLRLGPTLVGVNTGRPNALAEEAIRANRLAPLAGYASVRREVRYGTRSRIDLLLEGHRRRRCYVEVKNVHMSREPGVAEFPDSVTDRGRKHLSELARRVAAGDRAVMLYLVQREDCSSFRLAGDIDPAYADAFRAARDAGVEMLAYRCRLTVQATTVGDALVMLDPVGGGS